MVREKTSGTMFTYDEMVEILKGYREVKNKVLQLEFEISNYKPVLSGEDVIDSMTFNESPANDSEQPKNGTDHIALSYAKKAENINLRHKLELEKEAGSLRTQKERIEYYISLLDEKYASVLRLIYLEGKTILAASEILHVSDTTIKKTRRAGIKKLIEMYARVFR